MAGDSGNRRAAYIDEITGWVGAVDRRKFISIRSKTEELKVL